MGANVKLYEDHTVEKALQLFPYFDTWSRKTISDCCRLSNIKVIPPDGIILDSEEQESAGVHFIMEGTCKLIEHLTLVPKKRHNGAMKYSVFSFDSSIARQMSVDDKPKYSSLLFNMEKTDCLENETPKRVETLEDKSDEVQCEEMFKADDEEYETAITELNVDDEVNTDSGNKREPEGNAKKGERAEQTEVKKRRKFYQFYRRMLPYVTAKNRIFLEKPCKAESHFIQVALVHKGCCLGLGENLRNRCLVSVTKVTCLVIPLQFLLQHNPNNIWNRIKQFLNDYLPSEERILTEFVINKKWNECKRKLVKSKGAKSLTNMSDVPISVRLNDANMRLDLFQHIFLRPPCPR